MNDREAREMYEMYDLRQPHPGTFAPASIRVSINDRGRLPSTLRGRLERRQAELVDGLTYASDWADHRYRVGQISGLGEAIEICAQIEKDLNE